MVNDFQWLKTTWNHPKSELNFRKVYSSAWNCVLVFLSHVRWRAHKRRNDHALEHSRSFGNTEKSFQKHHKVEKDYAGTYTLNIGVVCLICGPIRCDCSLPMLQETLKPWNDLNNESLAPQKLGITYFCWPNHSTFTSAKKSGPRAVGAPHDGLGPLTIFSLNGNWVLLLLGI